MPTRRSRSFTRLLLVPTLSLLLGAFLAGCYSDEPGTIEVRVTGGKGSAGLGVEHCKASLDPDAVLTTVTVRDEDDELVVERTLYGRDFTAKTRGVLGRRCLITAAMKVDATIGERYTAEAEGYSQEVEWEEEGSGATLFDDYIPIYADTAYVRLLVGGELNEIAQLASEGYLRISDFCGVVGIGIPCDRARQIVKRDDFPAPAKVVGTQKFWLLEDLEAWWYRDGRHTDG
jgi:hypothetical protein